MPRQVNLEVVLVGQGIVDRLDPWLRCEDFFAHLVHSVLDAGALLGSKESEGDLTCLVPGLIEFGNVLLDRVQVLEGGPLPACIDRGTEDTVVDVGKSSEVVAHKVVELGSGALEHQEV